MSTIPVRYVTCADTAKLLRAALKAAHPGVRFSVRSSTYAGGASISVDWTDGPCQDEVDSTARRYSGATFDGMTDTKSYHRTLLAGPDGTVEEVHFGADFIFTSRGLSDSYVRGFYALVTHNGTVSFPAQCDGCGNWLAAGVTAWVAATERHDFCCSQDCAARRTARTGAHAVTA
ncbi:MAG: hypothetical protein NVS3B18_09520 [Candidatus Dormibacteria bacterium]